MIELTTTAAAQRRFSQTTTAVTTGGSLFVAQANHATVLVLSCDLDNLLEDVKIAIAIRDAE